MSPQLTDIVALLYCGRHMNETEHPAMSNTRKITSQQLNLVSEIMRYYAKKKAPDPETKQRWLDGIFTRAEIRAASVALRDSISCPGFIVKNYAPKIAREGLPYGCYNLNVFLKYAEKHPPKADATAPTKRTPSKQIRKGVKPMGGRTKSA